MDVILIRHGESEDNINKVYSRDTTFLTSKGREQILHTKERLKEFKFEKVYCSPLKRTKETLELLNLKGEEEPSLREVDFGIFKGKTFSEIVNIYPLESKLWIDETINYKIPQGESVFEAYNRIATFLDRLIFEDKDALLITHDGIVRLVLCWVLDSPDSFFKFKLNNGSISRITIKDESKYIQNINI